MPQRILVLVALLMLGAIAAFAQQAQSDAAAPPSRNANIWDARKHQPTEGSVNSKLEQSGLPKETDPGQDRDLNQIGQQLENKAQRDARTGVPDQTGTAPTP